MLRQNFYKTSFYKARNIKKIKKKKYNLGINLCPLKKKYKKNLRNLKKLKHLLKNCYLKLYYCLTMVALNNLCYLIVLSFAHKNIKKKNL